MVTYSRKTLREPMVSPVPTRSPSQSRAVLDSADLGRSADDGVRAEPVVVADGQWAEQDAARADRVAGSEFDLRSHDR